jgi:glycolate oxidase iron-sulfur subunit
MSHAFTDTDLCVKCGLCLPHCPTYTQTQDESESPRGRLALIQAWAAGRLQATPGLVGHIDRCLLCRSCEAVCPAQVPYGRLVDDFRAETAGIGKSRFERLRATAVRAALEHPALSRLAGAALPWADATGLTRALGLRGTRAGLPARAEHGAWHGVHPALGVERGRVGLFLGCTAELADAETVDAAIRLLTRWGVSVRVPDNQGCCGALALHAGDRAEFDRLGARNRAAFGEGEIDAIVTIASGCGAVLQEYAGTPTPVVDVCQYLAKMPWPEEVEFRPLDATVALHTPCTLKNVLKAQAHPSRLLQRIPKLCIVPLTGSNCCGAAGTYQIEQPDMAGALRQNLLDRLPSLKADYLLTSNVGCALHLRAGLHGHPQVMHPVTLLARQLVN